ncbi:MAG TPA: hypothetical protein PKK43_08880, partial [Spirochaetota bacterium]|nr:hypothetical protein [Spirochaetota bacterium]
MSSAAKCVIDVPPAPSGLKAIVVSTTCVKLMWNKEPNVDEYIVYSSDSPSGTYGLVTSTKSCSYTGYPNRGSTLYFKVTSANRIGECALPSSYVSATTPSSISTSTSSLQILNKSSVDLDYLYAARPNAASWTSMGSGIKPNNNYTFAVDPDFWNVKAEYIGTYSTYYTYGSDLPVSYGSTYTLTILDTGFTGSIKLINSNSSKYSITELNISPADSTSWGANQLKSPVYYGDDFTIKDIPAGTYDIRIKVNGQYYTMSDTITVSSLTITNLTSNN